MSSPTYPPLKRQKTEVSQTIPALAGAINQMLGNISEPQEVVDEKVQIMINQLNESLKLVTQAAQQNRIQRIAAQEAFNAQEMARQEQQNISNQINTFKIEFNKLMESEVVTNLTNEQRRQLFGGLTKLTTGFFTYVQVNDELAQDASVVNRFRELWMIMFEVVGTYVSLIKNQGPDYAKKTASVLASIFMFIGILPPAQRDAIAAISPLIKSIIDATYISRPYIKDWLQSGAVVTMIYYFLKNTGIETSEYIEALGNFAVQQTTNLGSAAITGINKLSVAAPPMASQLITNISNVFTNILGNWATSNYTNFAFEGSQSSVGSNLSSSSTSGISILTTASRSTQAKVNELRSISGNISRFSVDSIKLVLMNNEDSTNPANIVDPNQDLIDIGEVVKARLQEMTQFVNDNASISSNETTLHDSQMQYSQIQASQEPSVLSVGTAGNQMEFWFWDINQNENVSPSTEPSPNINNNELYFENKDNYYAAINENPDISENQEEQNTFDNMYGDLDLNNSPVGGKIRTKRRYKKYGNKKSNKKRHQKRYTKKRNYRKKHYTKRRH